MNDLPDEMIGEILSHLDKPSLFQASNVCKLWRQQALTHTASIDSLEQFGIAAEDGDQLSIIQSVCNTKWLSNILYRTCIGGHIDLTKIMIAKGAKGYEYGLRGACFGGHEDLVRLMLTKGAKNIDVGLCGACEGGHEKIVKLMMAEGARDYDRALISACHKGDKNIVKILMDKGIENYNGAFGVHVREDIKIWWI